MVTKYYIPQRRMRNGKSNREEIHLRDMRRRVHCDPRGRRDALLLPSTHRAKEVASTYTLSTEVKPHEPTGKAIPLRGLWDGGAMHQGKSPAAFLLRQGDGNTGA